MLRKRVYSYPQKRYRVSRPKYWSWKIFNHEQCDNPVKFFPRSRLGVHCYTRVVNKCEADWVRRTMMKNRILL